MELYEEPLKSELSKLIAKDLANPRKTSSEKKEFILRCIETNKKMRQEKSD